MELISPCFVHKFYALIFIKLADFGRPMMRNHWCPPAHATVNPSSPLSVRLSDHHSLHSTISSKTC